MPGIFYQPVNRRKFLGHSAGALALLALGKRSDLLGEETGRPVHVALLSDTHVPADPKTAAWSSFCQALFGSAEFRYLR